MRVRPIFGGGLFPETKRRDGRFAWKEIDRVHPIRKNPPKEDTSRKSPLLSFPKKKSGDGFGEPYSGGAMRS